MERSPTAVRDRLRAEMAERGRAYAGQDALDDLRLGYFAAPSTRIGRAGPSAS